MTKIEENIEYPYDSYGLFLGLISYPFDKDGRKIYGNVQAFFREHKERLKKCDPIEHHKSQFDNPKGTDEFEEYLYRPAGYRMFGSQGLAILSLVDDYAFPIRYFDKNDIQSLCRENAQRESQEEKVYYENFHSVVVMGVNERVMKVKKIGNDEETRGEEAPIDEMSIVEKAKETFLNNEKKTKYPFIGIIRLKINSQEFLLGKNKGIETVRKIRNKIGELCKGIKSQSQDVDLFHISVECYDNDEMMVLAFSNNLLCLFNFLGEIRSMKNTDLEGYELVCEKHVFGSTLISFGYDVDITDTDFNNIKDGLNNFEMKCMVETKSGHRDSLYEYLDNKKIKGTFGITSLEKIITGGCNIIATMPLNKIGDLEKACLEDKTFIRDIRKMKVVLVDRDGKERMLSSIGESHGDYMSADKEDAKDKKTLETPPSGKMKKMMKSIGISKMVRDSMISLYELYDNAHENLLQKIYLEELKGTLENFYSDLEEMRSKGYSIKEMEKALNNEIENMESAIYDRSYMQKHIQMPLEYTGGIQQYLTSFDYAYKKIHGFFDNRNTYVTITGAKRGSSVAHLFKLNINDFLYPELFITLIWKEIANFTLLCNKNPKGDEKFDSIKQESSKKDYDLIRIWRNLTEKDDGYSVFLNAVLLSENVLEQDLTSQIVVKLLTKKEGEHELLKYFLKDHLVLHFAFNDNFEMMWHFYFKTILQTTVSYDNLNKMNREHFIYVLLRLFIVAKMKGITDENIQDKAVSPFDSLVSALWFEHFDRTWKIAKDIFEVLQRFDFSRMCEMQTAFIDLNINDPLAEKLHRTSKKSEKDSFRDLDEAKEVTNFIESQKEIRESESKKIIEVMMNQGEIVEDDGKFPGFICSLFYAYMKLLYAMDYSIDVKEVERLDDEKQKPIKSLPRDKDGEVIDSLLTANRTEFYKNSIALLVDPTGGFFVPSSEERKKYFLYRTLLYRSLWNFRYTDQKK